MLIVIAVAKLILRKINKKFRYLIIMGKQNKMLIMMLIMTLIMILMMILMMMLTIKMIMTMIIKRDTNLIKASLIMRLKKR